MPRNAEVIRQWTILKELEASRRLTIDDLSQRTNVTTRTIRRDLEALQTSGFPLYDEVHDGKKYWTLETKAFKRLDDTGFTLAELAALYFSRTLAECLAATPFKQDVASALDKLAAALTPGMRQFFDRLPLVFGAKGATPRALEDAKIGREHIGKLVDATLNNRRAKMRYFSMSNNREGDYDVEPYRLVYYENAMYLLAYVDKYRAVRTFHVDRIRTLSLQEERFTPREIPDAVFAHSIGIMEGLPQHIEIVFEPRIAQSVREKLVHTSQQFTDLEGGGVRVSLDVSNDYELRRWILGYGSLARVISPPELAAQIKDEARRTSDRYATE